MNVKLTALLGVFVMLGGFYAGETYLGGFPAASLPSPIERIRPVSGTLLAAQDSSVREPYVEAGIKKRKAFVVYDVINNNPQFLGCNIIRRADNSLVGFDYNGRYVSTDDGLTWAFKAYIGGNPFTDVPFSAIVNPSFNGDFFFYQDENNPDKIHACYFTETHSSLPNGSFGTRTVQASLRTSTDGGISWGSKIVIYTETYEPVPQTGYWDMYTASICQVGGRYFYFFYNLGKFTSTTTNQFPAVLMFATSSDAVTWSTTTRVRVPGSIVTDGSGSEGNRLTGIGYSFRAYSVGSLIALAGQPFLYTSGMDVNPQLDAVWGNQVGLESAAKGADGKIYAVFYKANNPSIRSVASTSDGIHWEEGEFMDFVSTGVFLTTTSYYVYQAQLYTYLLSRTVPELIQDISPDLLTYQSQNDVETPSETVLVEAGNQS